MTQTVNDNLLGGWYGNLILITLFAIFFMGFYAKTQNSRKSLSFTSLLIAVFATFMRTLELVPGETVIIAWIILAILAATAFMFPPD